MSEISEIEYPTSCYVVGFGLLVFLLLGSVSVIVVHLGPIEALEKDTLLRAHFMCASFGMIGSSIATIRRYYGRIISERAAQLQGKQIPPTDWSYGITFYYLTRPVLGSVLGALSYTLSFIGFQILSEPKALEISGEGVLLLYAVALLSGFSVTHVLDRLEAISKQIFHVKNNQDKTRE